MIAHQELNAYSHIRGFNFQPSWGSHGMQIWLDFRPDQYAREIERGLKYFPKLNALRIWLSFDAYVDDRKRCMAAVKEAFRIIDCLGVKIMPVFFNGWHSYPDFGGFSLENLHGGRKRGEWGYERQFVREVLEICAGHSAPLAYDIANEPFNNAREPAGSSLICDFLKSMADEMHEIDTQTPVAVGTQGLYCDHSDLDRVNPFVDVLTIHPYYITKRFFDFFENPAAYVKAMDSFVLHLKKFNKPVIASECCWGSMDDAERVDIVRLELSQFIKHGIGFMPHALHHSKVSDLHRVPYWSDWVLYMAFIEEDGSLRPGHEVYNEF